MTVEPAVDDAQDAPIRRGVTRRAALACCLAAVASGRPPTAMAAPILAGSDRFQATLRNLTGGAAVEPGPIRLDIPDAVADGKLVTFSASVDEALLSDGSVTSIHILSTENPTALVASFRFFSGSGAAAVSGRMRLAKSQQVVALARLTSGRFIMSDASVDVSLGGCG